MRAASRSPHRAGRLGFAAIAWLPLLWAALPSAAGASVRPTGVGERPETGRVEHRAPVWVARFDRTDFDEAVAVAISPDGADVFVTGTAGGVIETVAYDAATGVQIWAHAYREPDQQVLALGLALDPSGTRVFVTGCTPGPFCSGGPGNHLVTVAYGADAGESLWFARLEGTTSNGIANTIGVSPDGSRVYVTASTAEPDASYLTAAYDSASGDRVWLARSRGRLDFAVALVVTPDDTVVVTGQRFSPTFEDGILTQARSGVTGERIWVASLRPPGGAAPFGLAMSPDGARIVVTGSAGFKEHPVTTVIDSATGTVLWADRADNMTLFSPDVQVTGDGSLALVTGTRIFRDTVHDVSVLAYEMATGRRVWTRAVGTPGSQYDYETAASIDAATERLYVAACVHSIVGDCSTDSQYGVMAFDALDGTLVWTATFEGSAGHLDEPRAIAASPDTGLVYVTGEADDGSGAVNYDFTTIAYVG